MPTLAAVELFGYVLATTRMAWEIGIKLEVGVLEGLREHLRMGRCAGDGVAAAGGGAG